MFFLLERFAFPREDLLITFLEGNVQVLEFSELNEKRGLIAFSMQFTDVHLIPLSSE